MILKSKIKLVLVLLKLADKILPLKWVSNEMWRDPKKLKLCNQLSYTRIFIHKLQTSLSERQ